mmetsp:Transcript_8878/g.13251  ORF Transcript_8878/g.13251 Transcript_8878/m.13251 type:complete len:268 (+) Transcript_8878:61-864(+)|eukprot:CAMPEP_0167756678 /NCGR_PEP_ID=MMETSP0110_2-20121227/9516_1 /TAXON_ID=629695 /ORGANISM="Gymnochlora sp., Strain CCMP2014" /LENGTH=267 /DNA_ID=CAMNT_0007642809 /DNA_START=7 /DNA_END=810 /DNA_ORIENTATION=-
MREAVLLIVTIIGLSLSGLETKIRTRKDWSPFYRLKGGQSETLSSEQAKAYQEALRILSCGDDWYQLIWGRPGADMETTIDKDDNQQGEQLLKIIRRMRADMHPDKHRHAPDFLKMAVRSAFERLNAAHERVKEDTVQNWEYSADISELYKVVWPGGVIVRCEETFQGGRTHVLRCGALVQVQDFSGRRARIINPVQGWVSVHKEDGKLLLKPHKLPKIGAATRRKASSEKEARKEQVREILKDFYSRRRGQMVLPMAAQNAKNADE